MIYQGYALAIFFFPPGSIVATGNKFVAEIIKSKLEFRIEVILLHFGVRD